eukprot:scaffold330159_cov64-Tisochrysis_lutea.AAC.1
MGHLCLSQTNTPQAAVHQLLLHTELAKTGVPLLVALTLEDLHKRVQEAEAAKKQAQQRQAEKRQGQTRGRRGKELTTADHALE